MIEKFKIYLTEPIIRLIIYHIFFIILIASGMYYTQYHYEQFYEKPAKRNIANRNNKEKLAHIIKRELLLIDSRYRAMLLSKNIKEIENLSGEIASSIFHAQKVLPILKNGGTLTDVVPVNFYDEDEMTEKINYKHNKEEISVDVINLSPKLRELKMFIDNSSKFLTREISKTPPGFITDNFELVMLIKQTDALLLRLKESTNKIFYDIKKANKISEKKIIETNFYASMTVLAIDVAGNLLVIIFAFLIAAKIIRILQNKKDADEKIKQTNTAMKTIVDNLPVGVVLVNSDKEVIQINEKASQILKYENYDQAQKNIGTKCYNFFCDIDSRKCPILDLGESKILLAEKKVIPRVAGNDGITVLKSVIPIVLDGQHVLMEVFMDISERKQHEESLIKHQENLEHHVKERTKELEQAQEALLSKAVEAGRAQLSAMILHNIGNAITPVNINITKIKNNNLKEINLYLTQCYDDLEAHKQDLGRYVTENDRGKKVAEYMGELIESFETARLDLDKKLGIISTGLDYVSEILTIQQSYSSGKQGTKEKIQFNLLVQDAIKMQQSSIDQCKIILSTDFAKNIPDTLIEKNKLMQVLVNFIKNSCDSITQLKELNNSNGKDFFLNISTYYSGTEPDKKIILEISDSGIGVEIEQLEKIFEFGVSTKGSSGFGLYYCKSFVESNNGSLRIESKGIGQGATVYMEMDG